MLQVVLPSYTQSRSRVMPSSGIAQSSKPISSSRVMPSSRTIPSSRIVPSSRILPISYFRDIPSMLTGKRKRTIKVGSRKYLTLLSGKTFEQLTSISKRRKTTRKSKSRRK